MEWRAQQISDPVERLKYLRQAMLEEQARAQTAAGGQVDSADDASPAFAKTRDRLRHRQPLYWALGGLAGLLLLIGSGRIIYQKYEHRAAEKRAESLVASTSLVGKVSAADAPVPKVWMVEDRDEYELYSNGLRIENLYRTTAQKRKYPVFRLGEANAEVADWRTQPAGIVYHTTEGQLIPFEAQHNQRLIRVAANLLAFIKQQQAYNFVIDRFGRVFRVVQETDSANHAGRSVWADRQWEYVGLNQSFIGMAFESRTDRNEPIATAAQLRAGRTLTEMLRSRYDIPAGNCVTHAQVSVNQGQMLIGAHTDWAGNFPFAELGLPPNYDIPLPSLYTFGFSYDSFFVKATGDRPWRGIRAAEERMRRDAAQLGLGAEAYRDILRERYKKLAQRVRDSDAGEEKIDERTE